MKFWNKTQYIYIYIYIIKHAICTGRRKQNVRSTSKKLHENKHTL